MATRDIETETLSNIDEDVVQVFFAFEMLFDSGALRLWTGIGEKTIDSRTWIGAGNLLNISNIEETSEIAVRGATISLSGIPSDVLSLALQEPYQGRVANLYFGTFRDVPGDVVFVGQLQNELTEIFSGTIDMMNIEEGPETCTIEVTVENKLIDLERPRVRRYSSGYQKSVYPNDKGFDFVEDLQDKEIVWGRKSG